MLKPPRTTTDIGNDAIPNVLTFADPTIILRDHQADIQAVIAAVSRRERLTREESDDLGSDVWIKLLQDGRRALGVFRGQSSLRTYLTSLVRNLLLDQRTKSWGKWRPCVGARRFGPVAVQLDRLMYRDGLTFDQAAACLATHSDVPPSQVEEARTHVSPRQRPRMVPSDSVPEAPARHGAADALVRTKERVRRTAAARAALMQALGHLADDERELLYMRFVCGKTIADISRELGEPQKPLYRRFEHLFMSLRRQLELLGVTATQVGELTATAPGELGPIIRQAVGHPIENTA